MKGMISRTPVESIMPSSIKEATLQSRLIFGKEEVFQNVLVNNFLHIHGYG